MSIQEFTTVLSRFVNPPVIDPNPAIGAVIAIPDGDRWFTGTYNASVDSFGDTWHTVASAFEQRHAHDSQFVWRYVWQQGGAS